MSPAFAPLASWTTSRLGMLTNAGAFTSEALGCDWSAGYTLKYVDADPNTAVTLVMMATGVGLLDGTPPTPATGTSRFVCAASVCAAHSVPEPLRVSQMRLGP